jgi:hypothetical protein
MDARIVSFFPEMPPMVDSTETVTFRSWEPPLQGDADSSLDKQV